MQHIKQFLLVLLAAISFAVVAPTGTLIEAEPASADWYYSPVTEENFLETTKVDGWCGKGLRWGCAESWVPMRPDCFTVDLNKDGRIERGRHSYEFRCFWRKRRIPTFDDWDCKMDFLTNSHKPGGVDKVLRKPKCWDI